MVSLSKWSGSSTRRSPLATARRSQRSWRRTCGGRGAAGAALRRRRPSCAGAMTPRSLMLIGRKLPTVRPRAFQAAGDRVLVGLWADTMEGRPARWWTVLTVHDGQVTAIADYTRHRDALRTLPARVPAAP